MTRRLLQHSFVLLNVDHVRLGAKWDYKNVLSPYYRIYYIDEGEGYISTERGKWRLEPGHIYLIPSFTPCNLHCQAYMSQYFIHFFEDVSNGISLFHNHRSVFKLKAGEMDITLFKRLLDINPGRKINRSDNPKIYEKSKYYAEYEDLNKIQDQGLFLETQGIILQLISRFMDRDGRGGSGAGIPSKVVELLDHIQLNLGHSLRVRELADMVNLHPDYLSRQLLQLTGERLLAYIHTKRIERAQYLIVTTDMSFSQIAEATGFDSLPHFSKVFKKKTSLTPGQYRAQQFG